jgi:hypothetical protein
VRATLVVPPLPKLRLWTVDATSGASVQALCLTWRVPDSTVFHDWRIAAPEFASGATVFPVALGRIELGVQADGYASARSVIEVALGWNEHVLELRPVEPREILVRLRSAGNDVPVPEETWSAATVSDVAGEAALVGLQVRAGASAILRVSGPGTYRVAIGRVPGFREPEAMTLVVGAERASLEFELVPGPEVASTR